MSILLPLWNTLGTVAGITTAQAKTRLLESTSRNVDTHSYSPQYLNTVRNSQTLTVYPGMNLKLHVSHSAGNEFSI